MFRLTILRGGVGTPRRDVGMWVGSILAHTALIQTIATGTISFATPPICAITMHTVPLSIIPLTAIRVGMIFMIGLMLLQIELFRFGKRKFAGIVTRLRLQILFFAQPQRAFIAHDPMQPL
jgi:hypothetical protein